MGTGSGQTTDGHGVPRLYGAGLHFIMAGGAGIETLARSGRLEPSGGLDGSPGEAAISIWGGHLFLQEPVMSLESGSDALIFKFLLHTGFL